MSRKKTIAALVMKNGRLKSIVLYFLSAIAFPGCDYSGEFLATETAFQKKKGQYEKIVEYFRNDSVTYIFSERGPHSPPYNDLKGVSWILRKTAHGVEAEFSPASFYYVLSYSDSPIDEISIIKQDGMVLKEFGEGWRLLRRDFN